jgi:hypothetical protein
MPEGQSLQTGRCWCLDRKIVLAGGAILIEALIFKAKNSRFPSRFSGIAEQQSDRENLCG